MSYRTYYERVVEQRGYKYIRLKSGRMITYWDADRLAEAGFTDMTRSVSRMFKLADNDYDLEHLGYFIDHLHEYVHALEQGLEKRHGAQKVKERIAKLRNITGRTPEEAAAFKRKARELEQQLKEDK